MCNRDPIRLLCATAALLQLVACADSNTSASDATPNGPDVTELSGPEDVTPDADASPLVDGSRHADVPTDAERATGSCTGGYGEPEVAFSLPGKELLEISGLVSSRVNPGVFWAHNDSGAAPELLAISKSGLRARLNVEQVQAIDWEDLARARCPSSTQDCLWVADMGNNFKNRDELTVLVIEEPELEDQSELARAPQAVYTFSYPDDTMDAEALLVSPAGDRFFVLEKTDSDTARVFSSPSPLTTESTMTLIELTTMQSPGEPIPYGKMITGADLHPSGSRIAVRCYTGSWEFRFGPNQGLEHLGEISPTYVALGPLEEVQGEAIAYGPAGLDLYTASEDPNVLGGQPMHRYACLP